MQKVNPYAANYNTPRPTNPVDQAALTAQPIYKPMESYPGKVQMPMSQPGRPIAPGLTVKDSGAPINFAPQSMQTMTDMFGSPIQNSYNRNMSPMKQDMMMDDMSTQVDPMTGMPFDETTY
jgi:hypothetical protein